MASESVIGALIGSTRCWRNAPWLIAMSVPPRTMLTRAAVAMGAIFRRRRKSTASVPAASASTLGFTQAARAKSAPSSAVGSPRRTERAKAMPARRSASASGRPEAP
jgi:hypothetical protein